MQTYHAEISRPAYRRYRLHKTEVRYRYGINVCDVAVTGQEQLRRLGKNTKTRETRTVGESKIKFVTKV
jgi:hypothetical protein